MIELVNVCAGYDRKEILHQIHLKLEVGKVTVLVGPNGCGKSTLLKTLVRILPCTSGEILIDGVNLKNIKTRQLAQKVAYLPQSRRIADISVLRLVLHGRFSYLTYPRRQRGGKCQPFIRWNAAEGVYCDGSSTGCRHRFDG